MWGGRGTKELQTEPVKEIVHLICSLQAANWLTVPLVPVIIFIPFCTSFMLFTAI